MKKAIVVDFIKSNMKPILGFFVVLFVIIIVWQFIKRVGKGAKNASDTAVSVAEDQVLSQQSGVSPQRVNDCRQIALELSNELETNKALGFMDNLTHLVSYDNIETLMSKIKGRSETILVQTFYKNLFTDAGNLKQDIESCGKYWSATKLTWLIGLPDINTVLSNGKTINQLPNFQNLD
jgi:preprotein translocase subunit SecF